MSISFFSDHVVLDVGDRAPDVSVEGWLVTQHEVPRSVTITDIKRQLIILLQFLVSLALHEVHQRCVFRVQPSSLNICGNLGIATLPFFSCKSGCALYSLHLKWSKGRDSGLLLMNVLQFRLFFLDR